MKIVFVNQAHPTFGGPGGAERSVKTLAEAVATRGHEVVSVAMAQKEDTGHLAGNGIHSEHRIAGVRTILLGKVERAPSEVDMILDIVGREKPDVVHTNTFWHNDALWAGLGERRVPVVHTLREYKLACPENMTRAGANCAGICDGCQIRARANRIRTAEVRSVVGISRYVLDRHLKLGFFQDTAQRAVVPNPIAMAGPQGARAGNRDGLVIGFLGRLHPSKGVDELIDAVTARPDDRVRLLAAGEIQDAAIDRKVAGAEGDPRFSYLGFVDPADLFARIDVLAVPSRWPEPFGRIVIEAFAHGIPVLASRRGALPELVTPGQTGWLYDDEDGGIAAAVDRLIGERERIGGMRAACVSAAERCAPPSIAAQYETIYARAARGEATPAGRVARAVRESSSRILRGIRRQRDAMRVLVVTGEFPKLSETFVTSHITGLIERGADVTVFAERRGGGDQWQTAIDTYGLMDRTLWYGMPPALQKARDRLAETSRTIQREIGEALEACSLVGTPPPLYDLARRLMDEQVRIDVKLRLFHAAEVLTAAGKTFDVVHCHFGHRGVFAAELRKMQALTGALAVSFHGIDLSEHLRRRGTAVYDGLKGACDLYLPISNFFRERLLRLGIAPRQTAIHHVGIDCARFAFAPRMASPGEPLRLLSVGRLVAKKGTETALRAIAALGKNGRAVDLTYDIVGDGPERGALKRLAAELKVADRVTFHGALKHEEVARLMARSHVFVAPSQTGPDGDMEGIPTTIMEAMASGLPVVATRHSGIPELVKERETGLLVDERDFAGLATAIRTLSDSRELWPEFGRAGRAVVEAEFNAAVQASRLMQMYEGLVPGRAETGERRAGPATAVSLPVS